MCVVLGLSGSNQGLNPDPDTDPDADCDHFHAPWVRHAHGELLRDPHPTNNGSNSEMGWYQRLSTD